VLKEFWSVFPDMEQGVFLEAEFKLGALSSTDLRGERSLTVGESLLRTELCGARFTAQVAAAVGLEAKPKGFSKLAVVTKDAAAIRYANKTAKFIANYLRSSVLGKRPRLIRKGI
jgi:hypothetical protein